MLNISNRCLRVYFVKKRFDKFFLNNSVKWQYVINCKKKFKYILIIDYICKKFPQFFTNTYNQINLYLKNRKSSRLIFLNFTILISNRNTFFNYLCLYFLWSSILIFANIDNSESNAWRSFLTFLIYYYTHYSVIFSISIFYILYKRCTRSLLFL